MQIFLLIFQKLIPLYILILLGFISGKYLKTKKETIAPLLLYIIVPAVMFHAVMTTKLSVSALLLPLLLFVFSTTLSLCVFFLSQFFFKDARRNILSFTAGTGNTGYFGLPIALLLFDSQTVNLYLMCILGIVLYQNSVGFYITAKGHHTAKESLMKVLTLPALYAFICGLVLNLVGIRIDHEVFGSFRGAYTILGMMIIGMGIADIKSFQFDFRFISFAFLVKFLAWPVLMGSIIFLDQTILHVYTHSIYQALFLLSIVPLAADTVAVATLLKTYPEKAAFTVLLSTFFALFYIPLMLALFFRF